MIENQYEKRIKEIFSRFCQPVHEKNRALLGTRMAQILTPYTQEPWALFGTGELTEILFQFLDFSKLQNFKGFFVNDPDKWGTEYFGGIIHNPDTVVNMDVKTLFNFTISYYAEVVQQFSTLNPNIKVIDFMTEVHHAHSDFDGYQLGCGYIQFCKRQVPTPLDVESVTYLDLYIYRRLYETTEDPQEKKELLEYIIASYVLMRDFVNGFLYMDRFVADYGGGHYDVLKQELESVLQDLKECLQARETRDILLVLLDNLSAHYFYKKDEFSYLNKLAQEGTYYEKAYSPSLFTSESLSATWRKTPAHQLFQEIGDIGMKAEVDKRGYTSGACFSHQKKITGPTQSPPRYLYDNHEIFQDTLQKEMLPQQYWYALTAIATAETPHFVMMHAINETHHPFYCGGYQTGENMYPSGKPVATPEVNQAFLMKRLSDVFTYVDVQSEFYLSMLGEAAVKVVFADHGRCLEALYTKDHPVHSPFQSSRNFHIPLIVHGGNVPQKQVSSVCSTLYLSDLLTGLMDGKDYVPSQPYGQVANLAIRSEALRKQLKYEVDYEVDGFRMVLDEEYKMIRNAHGVCRYFAMAQEHEELHDPLVIAEIQRRFAPLFAEEESFDF